MAGPWSTKSKVVVGVIIAAAGFVVVNVVYFGFVQTIEATEIDLATLRWQRTREWRLWEVTISRKVTDAEPTPVGQALADAGLETGLSGRIGTYDYGSTVPGSGVVSFDTGLSCVVEVACDSRIVALIRGKGKRGLPTLRRVGQGLRFSKRAVLAWMESTEAAA